MPTPKQYKVQLKLGDKEYKAKGDTIAEALAGLKLTRFLKTKGLISVTYGKQTAERLMTIIQMKRVFNGGRLAREVFAKHLSLFLK